MFTINKVQNEKRDRAPFRRSADRRRCRAVRIDEGLKKREARPRQKRSTTRARRGPQISAQLLLLETWGLRQFKRLISSSSP